MSKLNEKKEPFFEKSVARKFILYIILFSLLITLAATSLQLYIEYARNVRSIHLDMREIKTAHLQNIINSLWISDMGSVDTELKGILNLPGLAYLQIKKGNKIIASLGIHPKTNPVSADFPLSYVFRGKAIDLGTLHAEASLDGIYQHLMNMAMVLLATEAVNIFLVAFFIFFIFYYLVGRHLNVMARYARYLNLERLENPLKLDRYRHREKAGDELDAVVTAINEMRRNLIKDIKVRLLVQEELKKNEELLNAIIEGITDAIFLKDLQGRYILANKAALQALGKPREEVIGHDDRELLPPDSASLVQEMDSQVMKSGKTLAAEETIETGDGHTFWQINKTPFLDKNGSIIGIIGVSRNITEFKRAESQKEDLERRLKQAQKMEAIGTLAGGIAHDFNNILTVVFGYADMANEYVPKDSPAGTYLAEVLAAAGRAKDLVKQILTFSRQANAEIIAFQPASIIKEAIKMLRSSMPTTITIYEDIAPDCKAILADPTQVHQVLMNLCTNAFHAMEKTGGELHISLKNAELHPEKFAGASKIGVRFVELSVRDTGSGIPTAIRERIFEPYFTTKETGKGTGMGLSIIHGIVKSYGGEITVETEEGQGTTFNIFFPCAGNGAVMEKEYIDTTTPGGHEERILFVDDEELLVKMGQDMLERLGYAVTAKNNSIEAMEIFKNQPDNFDLVITDQTMPGLTGAELARNMLQIRPDLPIILCTGYSSILSEKEAKAIGIKEFALKPLLKRDIAKLIRKCLDDN